MKKSLMLTVIGAALIGSAHAGSFTIGNFETAALDGYGTDGGPGTPTLAQGTVGVTSGAFSLKASVPQGNFWGPSTGNLMTTAAPALKAATTLSYDLTMNNADLNGGTAGFNGFAQDNEIVIQLFSNAGGSLPSGVNAFIQESWSVAGVTDSSGQNAGWNGVDGTRHLTWDLTKFTLTDPTTSSSKTVAQFLIDHPDTQDAKIGFVAQVGNGTATVGPAAFYFDNIQLNGAGVVPEPAPIAALGLGAIVLIRRRRNRR